MRPHICLAMIVKNESHVLARAIDSVRHLIDSYAIVDTGSTDDTEAVARKALEGLPGAYVQSAWYGFGPARTRSLWYAEREVPTEVDAYAFVVDADEIWTGDIGADMDDRHLAYAGWVVMPRAKWTTARLFKLGHGIKYEGVVHEMPTLDGKPIGASILDGLTVTSPNDGSSHRDPNKYLEHAKLIHRAIVEDPTNHRDAFYLAQSYRDHGDDAKASILYLQRAAMGPGPEPEQVYVSFLEAGRALWRLGRQDDAKRAFWNAHQSYPARREAMAELARLFAVKAATAQPVGTLFVETSFGEEEE